MTASPPPAETVNIRLQASSSNADGPALTPTSPNAAMPGDIKKPLPFQGGPFSILRTGLTPPLSRLGSTGSHGVVTPPEETSYPSSSLESPSTSTPHMDDVLTDVTKLRTLRESKKVVLDGYTLDIPSLVAVTRGVASLELAEGLEQRVTDCVQSLLSRLEKGEMVYGVNTGFGGSADVRTDDLTNLQMALVQHQNVGVLSPADTGAYSGPASDANCQSLPSDWARGTMLVRINTIIRGHSAVSMPVIRNLCHLVENNVVPVIPSRGTVSASGDLMPLSYIAGLLQGNPAIYARVGSPRCNADGSFTESRIMSADKALEAVGLKPLVLGPKEGLGLLNGTAASGCAGALVMNAVNQLALLTQATTALNVEALAGTAQSFHPFIAAVRPHPGQIEVAQNIMSFLQQSDLATGLLSDQHKEGLAQDRYALRTASQFLGPVIEDLRLATSQIRIELNSTTDNPLVDPTTGDIYHGGNFQGVAVSLAMEKTRLACALMGKLLFAQTTELMNPAMNRGLPPNLAPDDPSTSFLGKGVDIAIASYCSELNYLANPVITNVQSAEMHNQSVYSLALVSARYTNQAADVLSMMLANAIWAGLQGVDLRIVQMRFFQQMSQAMARLIEGLAPNTDEKDELAEQLKGMKDELCARLSTVWSSSAVMDLRPRSADAALAVTSVLLDKVLKGVKADGGNGAKDGIAALSLGSLSTFQSSLASEIESTYRAVLAEHAADHLRLAPKYLGSMSRQLYLFVRQELGLGFHTGRTDDPLKIVREREGEQEKDGQVGGEGKGRGSKRLLTVGGQVSMIYEAVKSGVLVESVFGKP